MLKLNKKTENILEILCIGYYECLGYTEIMESYLKYDHYNILDVQI